MKMLDRLSPTCVRSDAGRNDVYAAPSRHPAAAHGQETHIILVCGSQLVGAQRNSCAGCEEHKPSTTINHAGRRKWQGALELTHNHVQAHAGCVSVPQLYSNLWGNDAHLEGHPDH
jgi:hypothetical protein